MRYTAPLLERSAGLPAPAARHRADPAGRARGRICPGLSSISMGSAAMSPWATACCSKRATARRSRRRSLASARAWPRSCRSPRSIGLGPGSVACSVPNPGGLRPAAVIQFGGGGRWPWPTPGSAACWTRSAGHWTDMGPCRPGRAHAARAGGPAGGDAAGAARAAARSRRAGAELLRHLPAWPAAWPVLRLRRRQVDPARHARAAHRLRRRGARPGRRARARGAGIPRGRSGRGGPGPLRGRGRHVRLAAPAAPRRRPMPP